MIPNAVFYGALIAAVIVVLIGVAVVILRALVEHVNTSKIPKSSAKAFQSKNIK